MEKLKLKFEYCYGIKKLEKELVFSSRTFAIYARHLSLKNGLLSRTKLFVKIAKMKFLVVKKLWMLKK